MASCNRRFLLTSAFVALSGAALAQPPYPPMPPPRPEGMRPPPPGEAYVWRPGHWAWNGRGYVWEPGRYVVRQATYHEYVPGAWVMRHGAWVWVPPHWR